MIALIGAAWAGGYYYSDSGIVATGRGGAFVAGANNQFAQYYNPAGLIRVTDPTVNFGFSNVQQHVAFTRLDANGEPLPIAENQAAPFLVPQLGFTTPLVRDKLALAVGMVSPFAPSSDYDPNGAQRYSIIDTEIYQFSIGPSVAWRPHRMLTLGLGLQANVLILGQSVKVSATGRDDPAGDIRIEARAADRFTPNFNAGLLFEPVEQLTIGLAVQPPTNFDARGHAVLDFTESSLAAAVDRPIYQDGNCTVGPDDPTCATENGIGLAIGLPLVLRAGVAVRPNPKLEIEAAIVWQGWRVLEDIILSDIDPEVLVFGSPAEIPSEFPLPAGLRNTASWRLGAEYRIDPQIALRAGGFYENGSMATERLSVALVDPWKVQVGGGWSLWTIDDRLRIDGAIAGIFLPRQQIRDSEVQQIFVDVLGSGNTPATVGNGDLRSTGWVFGLQASWVLRPVGGRG